MGNLRDKVLKNIPKFITYSALILMAFFAFYPIFLLFMNSLKDTSLIGSNPFSIPSDFTFENYPKAWKAGKYSVTLKNSIILTFGTIFVSLIVSGLAAFALARLKIKGASIITFYLLIATAIPAHLYIVPLFFMWKHLGLIESHFGLIIIYVASTSPFAIFLLRSYLISLPEDFVEAARIDGANNFEVLRHIILPLSWPGFFTAGLVIGLGVWNEFLFANTFLHHPSLKPISTSLYAFAQRYGRDWGLTNAASVMMILPVMILFIIFQKKFIEGLTQGGLKA